jgi:uncharacterized RDD family membrane protein YckC
MDHARQPVDYSASGNGSGLPADPATPAPPTGSVSFVGWPRRALGLLLDGIVLGLVTLVLVIPSLLAQETTTDALGRTTSSPTTASVLLSLGAAFALLAAWVVDRGVLQGRSGASLGRRVTRTRLVDRVSGRPLGVGRALGRDLAHVLDAPFALGWLWPLWDPRRQTFADKVVGSVVVPAA